jgi:hypothetical protein
MFEEERPSDFPSNWKVRGDEDEAKEIYRIVDEDGNRFLRARSVAQGVQIGFPYSFEADAYPFLRWQWRAGQLPTGADERVEARNDSAAGVYVLFDSRWWPRVIKYVWSSSLPVGAQLKSPAYRWAWIIVLRSGPAEKGTWYQETVNIYEDYRRLFEREPGKVYGIGILTDSNNTKTQAAADYDDFLLLSSFASESRVTGVRNERPNGGS